MPNVGPSDGWRSASVVGAPIRFSPWASPTDVVVLPSPSGVGVTAVTTTYRARGRSASSRSAAGVTLAT